MEKNLDSHIEGYCRMSHMYKVRSFPKHSFPNLKEISFNEDIHLFVMHHFRIPMKMPFIASTTETPTIYIK